MATTLPPSVAARLRQALIGAPITDLRVTRQVLPLVSTELDGVKDLDVALDTMAKERIDLLPLVRPQIISNVDRLLIEFLSRLPQKTTHIVFTGRFALGGAERYAFALYEALVEEHGKEQVVLVTTDQRTYDARHWLAEDANVVVMDELQPMLDDESKMYILRHAIAAVRPRAIINVNAYVLWAMLLQYGKPLAALTSVYSCLFCYDYREDGIASGYARTHFMDTFDAHAGYLIDNDAFRSQLIADFAVPFALAGRLRTLYTPVPATPQARLPREAMRGARKQVLWASRFAHQKQPLLALEVARLRPDVDFHFFGGGGPAHIESLMRRAAAANVHWRGVFEAPEALVLSEFDAMLYTAIADGIPTILLHVGAGGLPIVASAVGGVPELVTDSTGWPVRQAADPVAYANKLDMCLSSARESSEKAERMQQLIARRHDVGEFRSRLTDYLGGRF